MRKIATLSITLISVMLFAAAVFAQGDYFVQSAKARVLSAASFKSSLLGEVGKGYKFASLAKQGSWVKVKYKGKVGYVPALLLSTHPPFEKVGLIKADESDIKQGVRRRASSYTSAAAARGLAQDDRRRLSKEEKVDYESLDKVESFKVTPEELSRFMEGGKL
jgi:uncharacterized protein YgiM (DUF1202 family)